MSDPVDSSAFYSCERAQAASLAALERLSQRGAFGDSPAPRARGPAGGGGAHQGGCGGGADSTTKAASGGVDVGGGFEAAPPLGGGGAEGHGVGLVVLGKFAAAERYHVKRVKGHLNTQLWLLADALYFARALQAEWFAQVLWYASFLWYRWGVWYSFCGTPPPQTVCSFWRARAQ